MDLPRRTEARIVLRLVVIGVLLITSCSKTLYRENTSRESGKPDDEQVSGTDRPGRNSNEVRSGITRDNDRSARSREDGLSNANDGTSGNGNEISIGEIETPVEISNDFLKAGSELSMDVGNAVPGQIIETALKYIGVPHCMGGTTRECMDCSGFLLTAFASHGIRLPHSAEEQARYGRIIHSASQLKRGDLVFFTRSYRTSRYITHSGIYLGNNEFIHASSTSGVTVTSLSNWWWREKFVFGTRLFEP